MTRAKLIQALKDTHDFDADGIYGATDIGNRATGSCFVLMQVRNGRFVRVFPAKGLDCHPENVVKVAG
jgi:hypothetical protein